MRPIVLKSVLLFALFAFAAISIEIVRVQAADTTAPTIPLHLTATPVPPAQINLTWYASTDNVQVAGYYIYRNGILITSTNSTSFVDGILSPGGYTYAVTAYDASGNVSDKSASVTVMLILDTTPPTVPARVLVNTSSLYVITTAQVTISWNPSSDDVGVFGYYVYRNGISVTPTTSTPVNSTYYVDTAPPGTYTYTVAAYDAARNVSAISSPSASITITADTQAPFTPTNLSASVYSSSQINLSWATSSDNIGVVGYRIYRNGAQITGVNATSYRDSGLPPNIYTYTIAAYDAAGNVSVQSSPVSATVFLDNALPSTPLNISAVPSPTSSSIGISWSPSYDNVWVLGYYVYRNGAKIATVASSSYQDTRLAAGTYAYTVAAYDTSGNASASSSPVSAALVLPSAATTTSPAATTTPSPTIPPPTSQPPATPNPLTTSLYYGIRNTQVKILQSFLAQLGYMSAANATGFFGSITQGAVKQFQCDYNVVCNGDIWSTGWGFVGQKTRNAMNGVYVSRSLKLQ